jgi:truncated hemoglobin YjbI
MSTQNQPSLYERLGGVYSIATVVDDFIDRVMADPRLNANPAVNEAHHKVPPAGFKYLATEMVCWATGGPQKYTGRSMADSHRHLNITPKEWEAFRMTFSRRSISSRFLRPNSLNCGRLSRAPMATSLLPRHNPLSLIDLYSVGLDVSRLTNPAPGLTARSLIL